MSDMLCFAVPCCSDNADLEAVLKETERQRREFAARYAFMTLDTDADGYVSVEQVGQSVTKAHLKCYFRQCDFCS